MKTKRCSKCGRVLLLSEFGKHKITPTGIGYWCKECNNKHVRDFSKTSSGIYTALKSRIKFFENKPLVITREEFTKWYNFQEKKCTYCDIPEDKLNRVIKKFNIGNKKRLTLDRKDNVAGYILDNITLACGVCNIIKNKILTFDEMMYVGQNFIKPKWMAIMNE